MSWTAIYKGGLAESFAGSGRNRGGGYVVEVTRRRTSMQHLTLQIDGMSCGHCVGRVEKALSKLDGVHVGRVGVGSAEIDYDPIRTPFARIRQAVDDAGYTARPVESAERVA
jgi:copper chaperone